MTRTRPLRRQADVIFDLSDYSQSQPVAVMTTAPLRQDQDHRQPPPVDSNRGERGNRFMAGSRIRRLAISPREQRANAWTPEQIVDHRTSMADARIALCIAMGNALDDIDPASGYSTSPASYDNARTSWIRSIKSHGFNAVYERASLAKALAFWMERRPQYLDGDDWLAAGLAAHRDYWESLGRPCNLLTCNLLTCDQHGDHATEEPTR